MRISKRDLDAAAAMMARAAERAGIAGAWALHHGASSVGVGYHIVPPGARGAVGIGQTRAEAWHTLRGMERAFDLAAEVVR